MGWFRNLLPISGRVDKVSGPEMVDSGSTLGWVKPKTRKIDIHCFSARRSTIKGTVKFPPCMVA